jgi:hypothetical protein
MIDPIGEKSPNLVTLVATQSALFHDFEKELKFNFVKLI